MAYTLLLLHKYRDGSHQWLRCGRQWGSRAIALTWGSANADKPYVVRLQSALTAEGMPAADAVDLIQPGAVPGPQSPRITNLRVLRPERFRELTEADFFK